MADINALLNSQNNMSAISINIDNSLNIVNNSIESMQKGVDKVFNSMNMEKVLSKMDIITSTLERLESCVKGVNNTSNEINKLDTNNSSTKSKSDTSKVIINHVITGVNFIDDMTNIEAKIGMINKGYEDIDITQKKINVSANSSLLSYEETANAVTQMGISAGEAFNNSDEIIMFTELINKELALSGTNAQDIAPVMDQVVRAMGDGAMNSGQFNTILSKAPTIIDSMAKSMGITTDEVRQMAYQGELTSDVMKNSLFSASDEITQAFSRLPTTFYQIMSVAGNNLLMAIMPAIQFISNCAQFIFNHWSIIGPLFLSIVAILGLFTMTLLIHQGILLKTALAQKFHALTVAKSAATQMLSSGATIGATIAQHGLNIALLACPITWIVIAIIALIAVIYAVIGAINKFAGTSISATGLICGAFAWLGTLIANIIKVAVNIIIQLFWNMIQPVFSVVEWVYNAFNGGFDNIGCAALNLVGQMISWFLSLGKVVTKIIDAIFGTSWSDGLTSLQEDVTSWGKTDDAITISREAPEIQRKDLSDSYDGAYQFGDNLMSVEDSGSQLAHQEFNNSQPLDNQVDIMQMSETQNDYTQFSETENDYTQIQEIDYTQTSQVDYIQMPNNSNDKEVNNYNAQLEADNTTKIIPTDNNEKITQNYNMQPQSSVLSEEMTLNNQIITENTTSLLETITTSSEDLTFLRSLVETKFKEPKGPYEVKVFMTNNNTINNEMDIDSVVNQIVMKMNNAVFCNAEGVHA